MFQGPELEEGETCYYKDDTTFDPDIALSYIGDKVQSILGHLQKDFEGGVSAENLGAKFGGYGSFLPTHQRSPSIWSQPKSPHRVHNSHSPKSPRNVCPEGPAPSSVVDPDPPSTRKDGSCSSPSMRSSRTLKPSFPSFDDPSIRQKTNVSSDKVTVVFPPSSNSGNRPDQRTLKVRIKVGPERVDQYNAEIYNLGLTSPSSSEGDSHDESDGLLIESHETPNESPANILKIMASSPVYGSLLLSPLCEDLLNLRREPENSVENKFEAAPKNPGLSVRLLNNNVSVGKKAKNVDKSRNIDKSEGEVIVNHNDCKQKTLGVENLECGVQPFHDLNCKPLPDTVREKEKGGQVKKRRASKDSVRERAVCSDLVKDTFTEHTSNQSYEKHAQPESKCSSIEKIGEHRARISRKDDAVDHGNGSKNTGKGNFASIRAQSDNSEGEGIKRTMDNSSLKVCRASASSEQNGFGVHNDVNGSSFEGEKKGQAGLISAKVVSKGDGLRSGGCAAQKDESGGKKDVRRIHLSKKDVVRTSLEHVENPKRSLEMPSVDKPKNLNLDLAKAKFGYADKLKERSSKKKSFVRVSYDTLLAEPPIAAVHSKEGIVSGLEQTVTAPVVIQEDWVGCDRCQKWRLLPYGTKAEHLPDKWVCSMLDWLPGMNHCDISEDETTKALHASYLVPFPENQHNVQVHAADGNTGRVISASAHHFDQNHNSDQMKQHKLKEKRNAVSIRDSVPSNAKTQLQRLTVRNEGSKVVKQSLVGVNATDKANILHPNKSTVSENPNKRKGEHVIGDDAHLRKKIKKESAEHANGKVKKMKSKDAFTVDNFRTSGEHQNGVIGHSGFPDKAAVKDEKKKSIQKNALSGGDLRISVKKHTNHMQDLPDNGPLGVKICNIKEVAAKKIKLKDQSARQVETRQISGSNLKEENKDGDFQRDTKPQVFEIEGEEFRRSEGNISKRKSADARFQSSGGKEYPVNNGIEREPLVKKPRKKQQLTFEDIDKLRQDLGCEQVSTAATSSSSKVSGSRKNRVSYMDVKGSPDESVSSSPVRMNYSNYVSPMVVDTVRKVNSSYSDVKDIRDMKTSGLTNDNGSEVFDTKNKLKEEMNPDNHSAQKHEVSSNVRRPFSDGSSLKSVKKCSSVGKKDFGKLSDSRISAPVEPWNGKVHIDLRQGDKQGRNKNTLGLSGSMNRSSMDLRPLDASVVGDKAKALKETNVPCPQNLTDNFINDEAQQSVALDASIGNKNVSVITPSTTLKEAEDALREAEELRSHADLIKSSGFSSESNYEYFKAALKFLHSASLLETCNGESSKHLQMSPMQMNGAAAQLFKTCAFEYEKSHEMAAAALAYKCMEVAYMRVVYFKSLSTSRVWNDLQSSLQMVPQGESPSSSASDVDNLNNLMISDKATLSKGGGSHAGNHVVMPRNRHHFVRLVDFMKDVESAIEATKKSQDTFAAARVELEDSHNKEAIVSVKSVIDFSFQNVEELVRLVWLAFNTINHQGLNGTRE